MSERILIAALVVFFFACVAVVLRAENECKRRGGVYIAHGGACVKGVP